MSFKLFLLQLTGQLRDSGKIETGRKQTEKLYHDFLDAESSKELDDFRTLGKWIKSGEPLRKRRELEALVYKGSEEYNQMREFRKLSRSRELRDYFNLLSSGDLERFAVIGNFEKMQEFWDLNVYVEDGQFEQEKKEAESQRYEGSAEQKHVRELEKLKKSSQIKAYQSLAGSEKLKQHLLFKKSEKLKRYLELKNAPERDKAARKEFFRLKLDREIREYFSFENGRSLKYFREMSGSHTLKKFEDLIRLTATDNFRQRTAYLKDRKKFRKSDSWKKFLRYKELASDPDVLFWLKFDKSARFRNYLDVNESFMLTRHNELKELTSSGVFLERKAYLEDKKKWEKTEEYLKEQQFKLLQKHPKVLLYFRYVSSKDFDFIKNHEVAFSDDFEAKSLDRAKWTPNTFWADRLLGDNFSQPGDLQAYNGGKNTVTGKGILVVEVRKEKKRGKQWHPEFGFVPVDFEYTSDTLSTIGSYWLSDGIIEAKIRFSPVKEVVSTIYLTGEKNTPRIILAETGPECRAGIVSVSETSKQLFSGTGIKNLVQGRYYIFGLERKGHHVTWKINDRVIFECDWPGLTEKMHLNITSLVVNDLKETALPSRFEVGWIRCYREIRSETPLVK